MIDKTKFSELMTAVGEYYGQDFSAPVLRLWWGLLSDYSDEQVAAAIQSHMGDVDRGRFAPKVSDIKVLIEGEKPNTDQIIAAAMKPTTALAVLCRIEIGTWNLNNWGRHQLKPLAESCISQIPEWQARIKRNELHEHERVTCLKYGVAPEAKLIASVRQPEALTHD